VRTSAAPALIAAPVASATPVAAPAAACTDCWFTFMHDVARSGLQTSQTGVNSATVANLTIRWSYLIDEPTTASPIVANGVVYVATGAGSVIAFDAGTGTPIWRQQLGGPITMTPVFDSGLLFVATHTPPAQFFALEATTGTIVWQQSLVGAERGAPLTLNGVVYVPVSGGDPGMCHQGGIYSFQELTGVPGWQWVVNSIPNDGGSVWSPVSYDGKNLVFGTGNTCTPGVANANTVVQLSPAGEQNWTTPAQVSSYVDDDFGGAALIMPGRVIAAGKNGMLYSLNDQTGAIEWAVRQTSIDGDGSIGSPATNGSIIIAPSGFLTDPNTDPSAFVGGYDLNGNLLWQVPTHDYVPGGAAITNDVAFVSIDDSVVALDVSSGEQLWSFPSPFDEFFYASPAVVSSGVYAVDSIGAVYALSLGTSTTASAKARNVLLEEARTRRPLRQPFGPLLRRTRGGATLARY
jgi:outer membrane protein assembly factor BamB